jgi:hypothetical protein
MRQLENPYANVDRDMAADDAAKLPKARRLAAAVRHAESKQPDLFASIDASVPRESLGSGNPYANVHFEDHQGTEAQGAETTERSVRQQNAVRTATKQEFRETCASILMRYSPLSMKGRLRPHHREFITRNEAKSPESRYKLLDGLRQFDLAQIRGLETYLHREDDLCSEAELRAIEDSVDDPA